MGLLSTAEERARHHSPAAEGSMPPEGRLSTSCPFGNLSSCCINSAHSNADGQVIELIVLNSQPLTAVRVHIGRRGLQGFT